MTRGYRLLVLDEEGAQVRELYVSRAALWGGVGGALLLFAVMPGVGYALLSCPRPPTPAASLDRPLLHQGLAQVANLMAAQTLQSPEPPQGPCGPNMVLIDGNSCPAVFHRCERQTDPEGNALHGHRCAEYKRPATCLLPQRQHLRYCIDRDEHVVGGEKLPQSLQTFADAVKTCESSGRRLCSNVEWTFACEGEMMNPYPYGFVRDSSACNADRSGLVTKEGNLVDLRAAPGTFSRCKSAFGVRDLAGNLEEYALESSTGQPVRKGGYWQPGANHCRLTRPHSEPEYRGIEVGFRCCADPKPL